MKVLFLKDVARVGQKGSVKEIADGYALNYLIPNGFAVQATPAKIAAVEAAQKKSEAQRAEHDKALMKQVQSLEGARFEHMARATEKGGLFKSITAADIAKLIQNERAIALPEDAIGLEKHLKEVGEHAITIKASGAEAHITLVVSARS